jgi:hypothetical protein
MGETSGIYRVKAPRVEGAAQNSYGFSLCKVSFTQAKAVATSNICLATFDSSLRGEKKQLLHTF